VNLLANNCYWVATLSLLKRIYRQHQLKILVLLFVIFCLIVFNITFPVNLDNPSPSRMVVSENGQPLRSFADDNGIWRNEVTLDEISPLYLEALIGYEDRHFYLHPGVNPLSLIRALWQYITEGKIISGGSTLTMQVARIRYPEPRTLVGKLKEIVRSLQLEWQYSKNEILTYYVNNAPFGGTFVGVQAAALSYFGYSAQDLTHSQAALLAVLPQAPSKYRPDRHPKVATIARDKLIGRLVEYNIWSSQIAQDAKLETIIAQPIESYFYAPLLAQRLVNSNKDTNIQSSIDYRWQIEAEAYLADYVETISADVSGAILVMENKTGLVRVYVGSADMNNDRRFGHVDMVKAIRSPGSTLKPFIYGLALDKGLIHSESLLLDAPLRFSDYQPENFSSGFSGPVSVSQALQKSLNVPAVQVLERLGSVGFYQDLLRAGATLKLPVNATPNLSVALGGLGSTLESLVELYASLGRNGKTIKPRLTMNSPVLEQELLSPGSAWIIHKILSKSNHGSSEFVAIKTGTSYGFRDSWAIGVSNDFTIGVWIGKPDGTPLTGHFGGQTAVPVLNRMFDHLGRLTIAPKRPDTVSYQSICWPTGQSEIASLCDQRKNSWVLNQVIPGTWMNTVVDSDSFSVSKQTFRTAVDTGLQVPFGCNLNVQNEIKVLWPGSLQLWLPVSMQTRQRIPDIDPRCPSELTSPSTRQIEISGIRNDDVLMIAANENQQVSITVIGGQAPYQWRVNDNYQTEYGPVLQLNALPQQSYQVEVTDWNGQSDLVDFETTLPPIY